MDRIRKNMDKNCAVLQRLAGWIAKRGPLPIPFVGPGGGRFNNPPRPHIELCVLSAGSIDRFQVGSLTQRLPFQHVAVHNVHFGNRSNSFPDVVSTCLFFDIENANALADLAARPWSCVFPIRDPAGLTNLMNRITERCLACFPRGGTYPSGPYAFDPRRDGTGCDWKGLQLQAALLEWLGVLLKDAQSPPGEAISAGARVVDRAEEFMRQHYAHPGLTLAQIAQAAHLSPAHFGRRFRQEAGLTPLRRLRAIRMEHARRLLAQPELRIREIARHVGYEDPLHFSRIFHAETGRSPRAFRAAGTGVVERG